MKYKVCLKTESFCLFDSFLSSAISVYFHGLFQLLQFFFFANSFVASDTLVNKLFVVTFLLHPVNGSISFRITNFSSGIGFSLLSSFPKLGNPFIIYLVLTSHANQNFMPNLSGLFGIYWLNLQLVFDGNNCSSAVMYAPGL